ncbi:unnamed protein product, partial [Scytosiphon promiscuus]
VSSGPAHLSRYKCLQVINIGLLCRRCWNRARGTELETVNPQALEGVPDAMSVSNLTQASLLHTVRERYNRDEVSPSAFPMSSHWTRA